GSTSTLLSASSKNTSVLLQNATVHHHEQAGVARLLRGGLVDHALLHPNRLRAGLNRRLYDFGNKFTAAEDVHDIDRLGNILQAAIRRFAEHFALIRIYG